MSDKIRNKKGDTVGWPGRQRLKLKGALKNVFSPTLGVMLKIYHRNINYMPAVTFITCLDFERKSLFFKTPLRSK